MSEPNWKNKTIWTGDNLDIMRGMNSNCVDLIYLDPPFNKNQMFSAPIGSEAAGASFKDAWTLNDVDMAWMGLIAEAHPGLYRFIEAAALVKGTDMQSYLIWMGVRLMEMKRILKTGGSLYLHCDHTAGHYLKVLLDAVFEEKQFRNEVIWNYGGRGAKATARQFPRNHDMLLLYGPAKGRVHNRVYVEHLYPYPADKNERKELRKQKLLPTYIYFDERWMPFKTSPRGDYTDESIANLEAEGRIYYTRNGNIRIKYYLDIKNGQIVEYKLSGDVWSDIQDMMHVPKEERTGFPTQKPLKLLERIVLASSNEDDMILDPFCGCATALVAAEKHHRQWAGIDLSTRAVDLVQSRLRKELKMFYDVTHRTDIPRRTDLGRLPGYRTHKHTLFGRQEGICAGCRISFPFRNLTIDHKIPVSRGGQDNIENLQLLCGACNSLKGSGSQEELMVKLRESGIIQ